MLIEKIKAAQLQARKEKNELRKTLLTTIIGETETLGKRNGNNTPTDAEVIQVLKKFEKNINENLAIFLDRKMLDEHVLASFELQYIQEFLPSKLTDEKVKDDIVVVMIANDLKYEQKSMGVVVKNLKELYGDQFDGQQVSTIFKSMLG